MNGFAPQTCRNRGIGGREVGINGELGIRLSGRDPDKWIRCGLEISYRLIRRFSPEIVQGHGISNLIKSPHPDEGAVLCNSGLGLPKSLGARAGEDRFGLVGGDQLDQPSRAGITGGPACPRAESSFARQLEVSSIRHPIIMVAEIEHPDRPQLPQIRGAGGLERRSFCPRKHWKENRGKNRDDRNHDKEFNQSKGPARQLTFSLSLPSLGSSRDWAYFRASATESTTRFCTSGAIEGQIGRLRAWLVHRSLTGSSVGGRSL